MRKNVTSPDNIPARLYRCNKCKRLYKRNSKALWFKSFCTKTNKNARLYRVNPL